MLSLFRKTLLIGLLILVGLTIWLSHLRADESEPYLITFISTRTGSHEIYVMASDGSFVQQITRYRPPQRVKYYRAPYWDEENDCLIIAYFNPTTGPTSECVYLQPKLTRETIAPNQAFQPRVPPTTSSDFAYTGKDDGNWFLFTLKDLGLYRAQPDGTKLKRLTDSNAKNITYLKESKEIVYFNNGWYILSIDGTGKQFIHDTIVQPHLVTVSPNNRLVAASIDYQQESYGYRYKYKIISRDTAEYREISIYNILMPVWSPDSRYLVYRGNDGIYSFDTDLKRHHLMLWNTVGLSNRFYVHDWSPDGQRLIVNFNQELYVVQPDSNKSVNLTDNPIVRDRNIPGNLFRGYNHKNVHWSPDGAWILFQSDIKTLTSDIYRVRPDGSDMQNLTNNPNWDIEPNWIPYEDKPWQPEVAIAGGLLGLVGVFLLDRFRKAA